MIGAEKGVRASAPCDRGKLSDRKRGIAFGELLEQLVAKA